MDLALGREVTDEENKPLLDQDPVLYRIDINPLADRDPGMKKKLSIGNMAVKIIN